MKPRALVLGWLLGAALAGAQAQDRAAAKAIYDTSCAGCHGAGVLGAPRPGDAAAWAPRARNGIDALVKSAIAGTPRGMPPKGGRADLSEAQLRTVIEFMAGAALSTKAAAAPAPAVRPAAPAAAPRPAAPAPAAPAAPTAVAPVPAAATPAPATAPATAAATPAANATAAAPTPAPIPSPAPSAASSPEVNAFNRLLRPTARIQRPAVESGIHDPANPGTLELQPPAAAFAKMPRGNGGNHVDWVKALDEKAIKPRWDRNDAAAAAIVMDLNIVREVKGSMPDVVYPHKQHTEWLDCANCHPAIFVPQKGANQISMASILLGQKCGVCHGKVAFPVSECRLCHSRKKALPATVAEAK
ncbi:MAG TPA: c(7)-type cytochrome triheme domain-containing protein [Burkholderiaceae bacterium]|nr:c(7)-type cytochrome triheme domain-containing protein [Burkholderiaceae bacterium]